MKGIILAGGSGTRLHPITKAISKQLLPVYDKPMIYYPLSILMQAKIKDILIISTPDDLPFFKKLLGNGNHIGINISYKPQPTPDGLAQAFIIGEKFIGKDSVCLVLGDNIFHSQRFIGMISDAKSDVEINNSANIFGYWVKDPERYGVVDFDLNGDIISIKEKPKKPKSNYAVVGLYFYPNSVVSVAKKIRPSKRGELEITSVNDFYLKNKKLKLNLMDRGSAWLDTGTVASLYDASEFVRVLEKRQGLKIGCIEEVALQNNFIDFEQGIKLGNNLKKSNYGQYILDRIKELRNNNFEN